MCGIVGGTKTTEEAVSRGLAQCAHRGPDARGVQTAGDVVLGHNRLSILDLDARSNQPMSDERGHHIVFNGEIYNYQTLRKKHVSDAKFVTTSDTEVLLHLYAKYGVKMAQYLHGMYAFALFDSTTQTLHLFRDHAGIKPLYYYLDGTRIAFASEMKALLATLESVGVSPQLSQSSITLYKVLGYVPAPQTLYENIHKLEAGTVLSVDCKTNKSEKTAIRTECRTTHTADDLMQLIEEKVLTHLVADVPVGVYFSGGTDSSLIASILHNHGVDLQTFSIRMQGRSADQKYFDAISKHLGLNSQVFDFGPSEFDEVYGRVTSTLDEPLADLALFPTYYLSKQARADVKVVLSGEGGDELFYGYPRSRVLYNLQRYQAGNMGLLEKTYLATPRFPKKNYAFEQLFATTHAPYSYYLEHMSPARDLAPVEGWEGWLEIFRHEGVTSAKLDERFYLQDLLLRKIDLATSYASIEGRVPLLDPEIMRNAPSVASLFGESDTLKPFLKAMLTRYLPHDLVYRGKSGFGYSFNAFIQESKLLAEDVQQSVMFLEERGIVSSDFVTKKEYYLHRYPNHVFSLCMLAHTIKNCENAAL